MGYLHSGILKEFRIDEITESHETGGHKVLLLNIRTDKNQTQYRICSDFNEPDIAAIKNDLNAGFSSAMNPNINIGISEFVERQYIHVHYPNGRTKQYTGHRTKSL